MTSQLISVSKILFKQTITSLFVITLCGLGVFNQQFAVYAQNDYEPMSNKSIMIADFDKLRFEQSTNQLAKFDSIFNSNSIFAPQYLSAKKLNYIREENAPEDAPHWLAGSYYSVENGLKATLMLNNKGIAPVIVQPTLYSKNGQQLDIAPVMVEANSFRYINLNDWINVGGENFREGNIRLYHTGKDLVIGAQIYLTDEDNSFSFEEKLAELGKFDSRKLEGIWAMPSRTATVKIVLTNTSQDALTVTGRLTRKPHISNAPQQFTILPHQTRVLDLQTDFIDGDKAAKSEAVALSLTHGGAKWSLLARTFISEPSTGYSNLAQFYNPTTGLMKEYHGAGIQMRSPGGERLKPVIVLRNTTNQTAVITGKVPYVRADGTNGSITLPATQLQPNEIRLLNTNSIELRNNQENIKFASLEIKYNTPAGSLGIAVHSESPDRNFVSRVPMWDPLRQHTATGGYPWLIEGTSATKIYIKNITDRSQKYVAFFTWENGGMYMIGEKSLTAHQTVEIDAQALRDGQIPDERGRFIPLYVSRGQFQWSLTPEDSSTDPDADPLIDLAAIGRSEQIDWGKKVSNNYACQSCCVGNVVGTSISPSSANVNVGDTVRIRVYKEEESCYGFTYSHEVTNANWTSSDPNFASVSGGTVTGHQGTSSSVTITAYFQTLFRVSNPPCTPGEGGPHLRCEEDAEKTEQSAIKPGNKFKENADQLRPGCGQCFSAGYNYWSRSASVNVIAPPPNITEIAPAGLVPGQQGVLVRIVGTNVGQTPTVNISGTGVTATFNILTPDGFEASFNVEENAQIGQRQLTVTTNGQTSNQLPFTIGDKTPVITSISQDQGSTGQTLSVTINGQNFGFNPLITFSQPGITYAINSATTTQINAVFTIAANATPGTRNIRVISRGITGGGFTQVPQQSDTSNAVPFQVTAPVPEITEVGFVEKNGMKAVTLSFSASGGSPAGSTIKLRIERDGGTTGSAVFNESGTDEVPYNGGGGAQTFNIKGVTESSQANNFTVKALVNGNAGGTPRKFTVASISSLEFERINGDDIQIDDNPGTDGTYTPEGSRIYPDKNSPGTEPDRAIIRVRAIVSPSNFTEKVYFASFDLDDPSSNAAPVDTTDANGNKGNDNNGNVNGSKSGEFSDSGSGACMSASTGSNPAHISKIDCSITSGHAVTNYKITKQPGDNFAVAASLDSTYRNGINTSSSAGTNLVNGSSQTIPISGGSNSNNVQGIRTKMLTVWRRLHIETDEMTDVTKGNRASGTFSATGVIPAGTGYTSVPINNNPALAEDGRFYKGRIAFGSSNSLEVTVHTATSINVKMGSQPIQINSGDSFTVYDDDDYNSDDALLDGDSGEPIDPIANILAGAYATPFRHAFITFDSSWASQYNQSNVPFQLNVDTTSVTALNSLFTNNRGSAGGESNDFWVSYIILGYQGATIEDYDGFTNCQGANCQTESPLFGAGLSPGQNCDCLNSSVCPPSGVACSTIPTGSQGSVILQEVIRDHKNFYQILYNRTITLDQTIVAHELGHQFGIEGDDNNSTVFKIMDYPNYNQIDGPEPKFHPEHINILRNRIKSPGQQ